MRDPLLSLVALLLLLTALPLRAGESNQFYITIHLRKDGTEQLRIHTPVLPTNAPKESVALFVRDVVFPKMQADAIAKLEPAIWQIGYFYLNGWGVPKNLKLAEAAFRTGPRPALGHGLWRVGESYMWDERDHAKAAELFLEALRDGCHEAVPDAAILARGYLYGWWKLQRNRERAEALLYQARAVKPDDPDYLLSMACLRLERREYSDAFDLATRVAPLLRHNPTSYRLTMSVRLLAGLRARRLAEIKPEETLEILRGISGGSGYILWVTLAALSPALVVLVVWTYRRRREGPGLVLSLSWISLMTFVAGLGFLLPLPEEMNNAAGRWFGATLMALVCLLCTRFKGQRYFGTAPLVTNLREATRIGAWLALLLGAMLVVGFGYERFYQYLTGHPLDSQLVAALLKCETTEDFIITVTVAGLLVPFYEEVLFRGFLFGAVERRWGGWWAVGVSSVIFAVAHGPTHAPLLIFIGLALGWLRLRTGDLRLSILLHCLNNTLATLALNIFGQ